MSKLRNLRLQLSALFLIITLTACVIWLHMQPEATPPADRRYDWPHWPGPERNGSALEQLCREDRGTVSLRTNWSADVGVGCSIGRSKGCDT